MKYDFSTKIDRRGYAINIDSIGEGKAYPAALEGFEPIPMWIADMNFRVYPGIIEEMRMRLEHPTFGYFGDPDFYYDSVIWWQKQRHGVDLKREDIHYENGVHGGNLTALQVFCEQGDKVLLLTPIYASFIRNLKANGYQAVHCEMKKDEQGIWRVDYEAMEKTIKENEIHCTVLSSPQNPLGRVWERWELEKMYDLFKKYDVMVISDEIWSDLILPGCKHVPSQSISEDARMRTVALYAPSKTFNLAGLVGSYSIVYNPEIRRKMNKLNSLHTYNKMNVMSIAALKGAYTPGGEEWLGELLQTIRENVEFGVDYIRKNFKGVDVAMPQGTYMLFIDCKEWLDAHGKDMDWLLNEGWIHGVYWQDGRAFAGQTCIRINLASPMCMIKEAFERLDKYVFNA